MSHPFKTNVSHALSNTFVHPKDSPKFQKIVLTLFGIELFLSLLFVVGMVMCFLDGFPAGKLSVFLVIIFVPCFWWSTIRLFVSCRQNPSILAVKTYITTWHLCNLAIIIVASVSSIINRKGSERVKLYYILWALLAAIRNVILMGTKKCLQGVKQVTISVLPSGAVTILDGSGEAVDVSTLAEEDSSRNIQNELVDILEKLGSETKVDSGTQENGKEKEFPNESNKKIIADG